MLDDDEPAERGVAEATELMRRLGIAAAQLREGANLDLIAARAGHGRASRDRQQS